MLLLRWRRRGLAQPPLAWVTPGAMAAMLVEAQDKAPLETGGILLGYWSPAAARPEVLIQEAVGPGPLATHGGRTFLPDHAWHRDEVARRYAESGRITTYLGDWHTHPGGAPTPSRRDRRTARAIARSGSARVPRPLMLILGGGRSDDARRWEPRLFVFAGGKLDAVDLRSVEERDQSDGVVN